MLSELQLIVSCLFSWKDKATWNSSFWFNEIEKLGNKKIKETQGTENSSNTDEIETEEATLSAKTEIQVEEKKSTPNIKTEFIDCSLTDLILGTDSALIQSVLKRIEND